MRFTCPHCSRTIDFSGERPRFCGFCGTSLESSSTSGLEETIENSRVFRADGRLPERIGGYEILRELGRGGMGVVCEARQSGSGRRVAIKLLSPKVEPTPETLERFVREGRLAAALSHPRSTFVFDAGVEDGLPYIVMELMPGRTLRELIEQEGPQPAARSVDCLLDVIEGLEAAHAAGVVHRDIKPSNCFLDADGRVKIGDFGLSKSLVEDSALTRTGAFMGTPQFAAPEQIRGGTVDERTDVYALGATLYYLISGRSPFSGDPASVIAQIVSEPAPRLRGVAPETPAELDRIVARMMDRDPARRFSTLASVRQALAPFASGGTSIADVGRRLAAYMVDTLCAHLLNSVVMVLANLAMAAIFVAFKKQMETQGGVQVTTAGPNSIPLTILGFFPPVLYFAIAECYWGRGLGKWLLGMRVVAAGGQRPRFWQTFVRGAFLPGSLGLPQLFFVLWTIFPHAAGQSLTKIAVGIAAGTVLCNYLPTLLFLTTMRRRNGFRGVHDLVTRTRVVRIADGRLRSPVALIVEPPRGAPADTLPKRCGTYQVRELLARGEGYALAVASDDTLGRDVWLEIGPAASPTPQRCSLGRPTRQRWLQGGVCDAGPWQAYEAVGGISWRRAIEQIRRVNPEALWDWGRVPLAELADELCMAVNDGTLPAQLSLEQLWVQSDRRTKLLDWPLESPGAETRFSGTAGAVELLRAAAGACTEDVALPEHARAFLTELSERPATAETLAWAVESLRAQMRRPGRLRWDDRLGVLGVSMGTEQVVYSSAACAAPFVFWALGLPMPYTMGLSFVVASLLPIVAPLLLAESPVFKALEVAVVDRNGKPASRWRRAWRDYLAWLPTVVAYVALGVALISALDLGSLEMAKEQANAKPKATAVAADGAVQEREREELEDAEIAYLIPLGGASLVFLGAFLFLAGAAAAAVAHPRQGVQDFLAGTRLEPK